MAIDIRHLRYFVAVAEEGHITRAADRLGIQQPPLSQRIRAMERALGAQLLRRKPRGVELTEAGGIFLANARLLLALYDRTFELTRSASRGEQGQLSIGMTPTAPFHPFIPSMIRHYREAFPHVRVSLEENLRIQLLEQLRHEQIDVAFLRASISDLPDDLSVHPLLSEPLMLALPADHSLVRRRPPVSTISIRQLANETFIFYAREQGPAFHDATLVACMKAGFAPRAGQEAPRVTTALSLVGAGLGISVVPASLQRTNMEGVKYLGLKADSPLRAVINVATRRHDPSPTVRQFVLMARSAAREFGRR